jgi:transposase-like protein
MFNKMAIYLRQDIVEIEIDDDVLPSSCVPVCKNCSFVAVLTGEYWCRNNYEAVTAKAKAFRPPDITPCPNCEQQEVYFQDNGFHAMKCKNCQRAWQTIAEFRKAVTNKGSVVAIIDGHAIKEPPLSVHEIEQFIADWARTLAPSSDPKQHRIIRGLQGRVALEDIQNFNFLLHDAEMGGLRKEKDLTQAIQNLLAVWKHKAYKCSNCNSYSLRFEFPRMRCEVCNTWHVWYQIEENVEIVDTFYPRPESSRAITKWHCSQCRQEKYPTVVEKSDQTWRCHSCLKSWSSWAEMTGQPRQLTQEEAEATDRNLIEQCEVDIRSLMVSLNHKDYFVLRDLFGFNLNTERDEYMEVLRQEWVDQLY